jgi:cytochrome c553
MATRPQTVIQYWSLSIGMLLLSFSAWGAPERVDQLIRTTLELEPDLERGAALYEQHCKSCHRDNAGGSAAEFVPSLAGQRRAYLIKQLADFAEAERDSTRMHSVVARRAVREPQEWADLTAYLNGLPVNQHNEIGDSKHLSLGEAAYRQWCQSCHEEDARGDDDGFVPSLRNQHYSYLYQQMLGLARSHRRNVDDDLVRFLGSLDAEEVMGLADYTARMRGPIRDRARLRDDGAIEE